MTQPSKDLILDIIYKCMATANKSLSDGKLLLAPNEILFGQNSKLDSLNFVNFVITVENSIEDQFGNYIVLVDEESLSLEANPFSTVDSLSNYILIKLNKFS